MSLAEILALLIRLPSPILVNLPGVFNPLGTGVYDRREPVQGRSVGSRHQRERHARDRGICVLDDAPAREGKTTA